jgi:predicted ATPase/DNA-binding SARP family transcriptional activator
MSLLTLSLLGSPTVTIEHAPVTVESRKALALLFYLAATAEQHHRDRLATLFWPEQDQKQARSSLRHVLWLLRKAGMEPWLRLERDTLALHAGYACDLHQFRACIEQGQLAEALSIYRDDFLAGFTLRDCPDFDHWQFLLADELRRMLADVLAKSVEMCAVAGDYTTALNYARRWLSLDPLSEPTHRVLIQLYAEAGQYTAALRQYELCVQMLDEEFGAPPDAETILLLDKIREAKGRGREEILTQTAQKESQTPKFALPATSSHKIQTSPAAFAPVRLSNLPPPPTPFIGRQREIADIIHHLVEPTCRLLTLVGPGGIGKTRLALQVARHLVESAPAHHDFADGLFFVPLATLRSSAEILAAITDAIGFQVYQGTPPQQQILDHLRQKRILLIMDNFEHLLDGVELIADILAAAPHVKILATSREALNLRNAWFYPVDGLAFPKAGDADGADAAQDALRLFEQTARRARPDFNLSAEQENVLRICRLVGGMPLAIELAAAWSRMLSCTQIIDELEHGLDILADRYRDMPERHRSMRASLEQSWQMLSPDEQRALRLLSVFRGSFRGEAATNVAGASLLLLATLIDKSVLRATPDGRYQMHELLHQFAREKAQGMDAEIEEMRDRHSIFYLDLLATREKELVGQQPQVIMAEIAEDLENIRDAWSWAVEHADLERIDRALDTLFRFYWIRGASQEGNELFTLTANRLRQNTSSHEGRQVEIVAVKIEQRCCMFDYFLGNFASTRQRLWAWFAAAETLNLQRDIGFAYNLLGVMAGMEGEAATAERHLQKSIAIFRESGDETGLADSLQELALVQCHLNANYAEAERLASESLEISRRLGRLDWIAHALDALAFAQFSRGSYHDAEVNYTESMELFQQTNHALGTALALGGLGLVAWARGEDALAQAKEYMEKSLRICRELGHPLHTSSRLYVLAQVNKELGLYRQAETYASEGFAIAQKLGSPVFMAYNLCALADVACTTGQLQAAREHLTAIIDYAHAVQPQLLLVALFHKASLLLAESVDQPEAVQREARKEALALLLFIQAHPALLHIYAERAARLQAELISTVPSDLLAAAEAQARRRTLDEMFA